MKWLRHKLLMRRISKIQRDEWPLICYLDMMYSLLNIIVSAKNSFQLMLDKKV